MAVDCAVAGRLRREVVSLKRWARTGEMDDVMERGAAVNRDGIDRDFMKMGADSDVNRYLKRERVMLTYIFFFSTRCIESSSVEVAREFEASIIVILTSRTAG